MRTSFSNAASVSARSLASISSLRPCSAIRMTLRVTSDRSASNGDRIWFATTSHHNPFPLLPGTHACNTSYSLPRSSLLKVLCFFTVPLQHEQKVLLNEAEQCLTLVCISPSHKALDSLARPTATSVRSSIFIEDVLRKDVARGPQIERRLSLQT